MLPAAACRVLLARVQNERFVGGVAYFEWCGVEVRSPIRKWFYGVELVGLVAWWWANGTGIHVENGEAVEKWV